jgi:hypothetical protein
MVRFFSLPVGLLIFGTLRADENVYSLEFLLSAPLAKQNGDVKMITENEETDDSSRTDEDTEMEEDGTGEWEGTDESS